MLKIKVEKLIETEHDGEKIMVHAGSYEQTVRGEDKWELLTLKRIVAIVNSLKNP